MILRIVMDGAAILRQKAAPVTEFGVDLKVLGANMLETIKANRDLGLAAPQVNVPIRLIVVSYSGTDLIMVNPVITKRIGKQRSTEGCLSVPRTQWGNAVPRSLSVVVEYQDFMGNPKRLKAKNRRLSAIIQHEIDHLDGILFTDYLKPRTPAGNGSAPHHE